MPVNLRIDFLPTYLQKPLEQLWFRLTIPNDLIKITRCDNFGKPSIAGFNWKIENS